MAAELHAQGCVVLVNAGPKEQGIAAEVVRASAGVARAPEFTSPDSTLERLIALTRRVCLVIAGDTGPLHLACALGKPVVGIYGPTDPARNGPFGVPFRVLRHPESKRDHSRHAEPEAGLLTITPQQVVDAAKELLEKHARVTGAEWRGVSACPRGFSLPLFTFGEPARAQHRWRGACCWWRRGSFCAPTPRVT